MNGDGSNSRWWTSLWRRSRGSEQDLAAYRRLALQLHYDLPRPQSDRSVLLVTPTASALCAHGAATLACCLAEEVSRPVLLMDASPGRPDVTRMLDCAARPGFVDFLADPELKLDDLIVPTTHDSVFFLPAGTGPGPSSQPVSRDGVGALLEAVGSRYDFVLLSGGSVLDNSMALALAPHVGCVLLLVIEQKTTVEDLDAAQDSLCFCKARKVGLVLTTPIRGGRWPINGAARR